jgi:Tfp pilus assembly protein PilV
MRIHIPCKSSNAGRRRSGPLRMLADSQAGFSIIEVVVSALMLTLMAGAVATALISTASVSGDQRRRSQADEIAQQDQERLKGMSIKQINGLNETRDVGPFEGATYHVTSTGKFLSNTGNASCSSSGTGAAAYVLVTSSVTWDANNRPPVTQSALITPAAGGTLLVNVKDQLDANLSGATVTLYCSETESSTTGSEGCAVFGGLAQSGYYVLVSKSGFVDQNGGDNAVGGVIVSGSGTAYPTPNPLKIGEAGTVTATFNANAGALTGQAAPSLSVSHPSRNAPLVTTPASPATSILTLPKLFPFSTSYTAWAGKCPGEMPPSGTNRTAMTVPAGGNVTTPVVKEPAMNVKVQYPSGTNVKPAGIRLTYTQTAGGTCSEGWAPAINAAAGPAPPTNGWLASPGQPFAGTTVDGSNTYNGSYTVCASFDTNGATAGGVRWGAVQNQSNSNFAAATVVPTIVISTTDSAGTSGPNSCPVL